MLGLSLEIRLPNLKFVSSAILELLAFNPPKLWGHVTLATPTFRKLLSGVMSGLSLGTHLPNLKFVPSAVLELLANLRGYVTVTTPNFWKYLSGVMLGLSLGTRLPDLKFVPLAVLEQTDRQTGHNRPNRNDSVLDTGHTTYDTRHRTSQMVQ